MRTTKKILFTYEEFIHLFPPEFQYTQPHLLRLGREGRAIKYVRKGGQRSVALFDQEDILQYARSTFGDFAPDCIVKLEAAFGISNPKKKAARNV